MSIRRLALSLGFALLGTILLALDNMPAQATPAAAEDLAQLPIMYE